MDGHRARYNIERWTLTLDVGVCCCCMTAPKILIADSILAAGIDELSREGSLKYHD